MGLVRKQTCQTQQDMILLIFEFIFTKKKDPERTENQRTAETQLLFI